MLSLSCFRRNARLSPRKRTRLSPAAASKNMHDEEYSPEDSARDQPGDARSRHADNVESRKKDRDFKRSILTEVVYFSFLAFLVVIFSMICKLYCNCIDLFLAHNS